MGERRKLEMKHRLEKQNLMNKFPYTSQHLQPRLAQI